ncbi:MAG: hypothetical protein ACKVT2_05295 [Saprospiraceae bacterium]
MKYENWLSLQAGNAGIPNAEYETLDKIKSLASATSGKWRNNLSGIFWVHQGARLAKYGRF